MESAINNCARLVAFPSERRNRTSRVGVAKIIRDLSTDATLARADASSRKEVYNGSYRRFIKIILGNRHSGTENTTKNI